MYPQANNPANIMFGGPSSSANQARLVSKQAELEGLRALKDQSARMVKELERLAEKVDIMADGGDCKHRRHHPSSIYWENGQYTNLYALLDSYTSTFVVCSYRFGHGLVAGRLPRHPDRPG